MHHIWNLIPMAGNRTQPLRTEAFSAARIEHSIHLVRGRRVMLDADLARIYGVTTVRLNEQVSRNTDRFPADFSFRLTLQEVRNLKSQSAMSSWGGRRTLPRAFTEHGALMLASVLNSPVAVQASLQVVRAFVRMRDLLLTHTDLARKLSELEGTVGRHDEELRAVFAAIRRLLETPPPRAKGKIGFVRD